MLKNSQNSHEATPFLSIRYLYESSVSLATEVSPPPIGEAGLIGLQIRYRNLSAPFIGVDGMKTEFITPRVRSTREGNIYTWECLSVHHPVEQVTLGPVMQRAVRLLRFPTGGLSFLF